MANKIKIEKKAPNWSALGNEPPAERKAEGFRAGFKPPAGYFNWFWTIVSEAIDELQIKVAAYTEASEAERAAHLADNVRHTTDAERANWNSKAAGGHKHSAADITSGALPVANGGTGKTTVTSGKLLVGTGTTAMVERGISATPTPDSTDLLTSGGAYAALLGKANKENSGIITLPAHNGISGLSYSYNDTTVFLYAHIKKSGTADDIRHGDGLGLLPAGFRPKADAMFTATALYGQNGYFYSAATLKVYAVGQIYASWKVDTNARNIIAVCSFPRVTS